MQPNRSDSQNMAKKTSATALSDQLLSRFELANDLLACKADACGTPVVAFNVCGLPDIVIDRVTGALADPFESASLSEAIRWVIEDPNRKHALGTAARSRAVRKWNSKRVAALYEEIYRRVIDGY